MLGGEGAEQPRNKLYGIWALKRASSRPGRVWIVIYFFSRFALGLVVYMGGIRIKDNGTTSVPLLISRYMWRVE